MIDNSAQRACLDGVQRAIPLALVAALACAYPAEREIAPASGATAALFGAHERDGRFFNPWQPDPKTVWNLVRWGISRNPYREARRRDPVLPVVANDGAYLATVEHSATVTWVGHATFAVHDADDVFLTDPHFGPRALVPGRLVPPGVPIESIPPDAFAVISHNHYDHLDAYTVERLPASVGWYVPKGLGDWFRARGREDVTELDWWETVRRGRFEITCLPSQHWSRRTPFDMDASLWCSWLLDSGDARYYFAGDTGYFHGFAEFGRRFAPIDVAMLPIGAYEPRWFMRYQHMNPAEALAAFEDLGARTFLPMHWGTFDLTDEPVDAAPRELAKAVAERGTDPEAVRVLAVGERWKVPETP
jgi:N-acyl-phosphatidylethanolamine-hydrolysing phospholipase D